MSNVKLDYTPRFWDPKKAYENYVPNLDAAVQEGIEYATVHKLRPAIKLMSHTKDTAHAAHLTDLQQDFRDHGRLPVPGTDEIVLRVCVRLLNGTVNDYYTGLTFSLDGHPVNHISFGHYWRDQKGNPLDLSQRKAACLTLVDDQRCLFRAYGFDANGIVELGHYQPRFDPRDAVAYWQHLQATN